VAWHFLRPLLSNVTDWSANVMYHCDVSDSPRGQGERGETMPLKAHVQSPAAITLCLASYSLPSQHRTWS
jgi:hypothetical protein